MARPASSSVPSKCRPAKSAAPLPKAAVTATTVLDRLDAVDDSRFRNRRGASRHRFRRALVPVRVKHPGGSVSDARVVTRNLSDDGIAFLHNGFLHNGTSVSLTLPKRVGGTDVLEGKVVFCQHVAGVFHQVGVRFVQKIFAKIYAADDATEENVVAALETEVAVTAAARFTGRLLVIDAQPMDRALVAHHLRESAAGVVGVESMAAAIEHLNGRETFDAVLCEFDVAGPAEQITETLTTLRAAGHAGAIVIAMATTAEPKIRQAMMTAGVAAVMTKPYGRAELHATLSHSINMAGLDKAIAIAERGVDEVKTLITTCQDAGAPPR